MPSKIKLTFLGTSDAIPTVKRNHTAVLLTHGGENILVDCGEGTQRQFRKAKLNPCKITKILLTHRHADHSLGLVGILQTLSLSRYKKVLHIYGPKGTKQFIKDLIKAYPFYKDYVIEVKEVSGKFFENKDFYLEAFSMKHGVPCNGYSFVLKGKIRIDKNKLKKLKIPSGKHLKQLKEGKDIKVNGKTYKAKNLTYGNPDTKVSFAFDTAVNDNMVKLAKDANLFVCDSSYHSEIESVAKEHKHMTAKQVAEVARKGKTKKVILTHISHRYEYKHEHVLKDAKKVFKNAHLVKDLDVVII